MKYPFLGLIALLSAITLTSCAARIYSQGNHSDLFRYGVPRQTIVEALGSPVHSGRNDPGLWLDFDEFRLRGPVHDPHRMQAVGMGSAMTFGIGGVVATPEAIAWSMDRSWKKVRVDYRGDGTFGRVTVLDAETSNKPSEIGSVRPKLKSPNPPSPLPAAGESDR